MKFGWRESATPMAEADDAEQVTEVDQEFEDACWALAMTDGPRNLDSESAPAEAPARVSPVLTAADLAEDDPAESAEDAVPAVPPVDAYAWDVRSVAPTAPMTVPVAEPAIDPAVTAELESTRAELRVARAELDALRADFEAERFRFQDERMRLEDDLSAERERSSAALLDDKPLGGTDEVLTLQREVDHLHTELAAARSGHADEIGRLEDELRAARAREAQTTMSAQVAQDELKAAREDDSLQVATRELVAARSEADSLRQLVTELQANEAERDARIRVLEAQVADRENDLRIARESAAERLRTVEGRLAATQAELAATQQELLEAEQRRAEEAASFLAALQK